MTLQDVGLSTVETREYLIRRFIRPTFGTSEVGSLTTEDITRWENSIPARTGVSRRVARDARAVLCTMLGDAAAAKPPLIPYNPAIRPRNRGRRTGRKLDRGPQRVWATPLQALLVAERAGLRAPPGPRGARHARPLRPHLGPDARGPQGRPPGPLGRLATRTSRAPPTLTRLAARRSPGAVPPTSPGSTGPRNPRMGSARPGDASPASARFQSVRPGKARRGSA
ncbi:MAG: hypothetical protein ACRDYC_13340 [Acidimicrobiales bacterium]